MGEDLVKAGNPVYIGLMAWVVPLLSRYMHTSPHTMCFGFPFSSSSFVKVVVAVEWIMFPPPPPRRHCLLTYCCLQEGGERRKEIPFSSAKPVVVRIGYFFFCWERREILGVGRCRLTKPRRKEKNKISRKDLRGKCCIYAAPKFFFGSRFRVLRLQNLPKWEAILGGEKKRERRINLAKRH